VFTRLEKVGGAALALIAGAIMIISGTGGHQAGATARAGQVHLSGPPAPTTAGGGLDQQVVQAAAQVKPDQPQKQEPPNQGQSDQEGSGGQQDEGKQAGNGSNGGIQLPVIGPPGIGLP
jgi:hypothetical protein